MALKINPRRGITIIEVIVVLIVLFLLIALLLPANGHGHGIARRRTQCRNNLKNVGLALCNYENKFGSFPPATTIADANSIAGGCEFPSQRTGGFSWRVLILPDVEVQNLYNEIDFNGTARVMKCSGTNGPPGATWAEDLRVPMNPYLCPSDDTKQDVDNGWHGSNYAAMISVRGDYRFTDDENHPTQSRLKDIGVLHPQKPAIQRDIANDGTSNTIMITEVHRAAVLVEQGNSRKQIHPRCGRWFNSSGCLVDGLRTPDDFGTYRNPKFDEASIDNPVVWDNFVGPNTNGWGRVASSTHGEGAHVGMTDGSVQWISDKVDLTLYRATCTRDGGETKTIEF